MNDGIGKKIKAKLRPAELYIALDSLDFTWFPDEVSQAIEAWEGGIHISDIAKAFRRPEAEVFLLLLDLASQGKITEREGGIFGKLHNHDRRRVAGA